MLLEILMQCSCIISHEMPPLEQRFCDIPIVIITNFVIVSSVGIKTVMHHWSVKSSPDARYFCPI